jgi:hypothetical protein
VTSRSAIEVREGARFADDRASPEVALPVCNALRKRLSAESDRRCAQVLAAQRTIFAPNARAAHPDAAEGVLRPLRGVRDEAPRLPCARGRGAQSHGAAESRVGQSNASACWTKRSRLRTDSVLKPPWRTAQALLPASCMNQRKSPLNAWTQYPYRGGVIPTHQPAHTRHDLSLPATS